MAWDNLSLAELGTVVTGRTPPGSDEKYFGGSVPFLTPTDMNGAKTPVTARTLSDLGVEELSRVILPKGIAVSCIGSQMGKTVIMRDRFATNQQINSIVPDESKVTPDFLYYVLTARREEIHALGSGGSTMPIVNKGTFEKIKVPVPPLKFQKAISEALNSLDDKIELNRKTNETLAQMAHAIFKSWFIDFDPVRAKLLGEKAFGMNDATAALFPDSFDQSELGQIPKGWKVSTISALTSAIQYGFTTSADTEPVGPKFLRITDIQGGRCDWSAVPYCKLRQVELDKYHLRTGDIVVARTGASTGENMLIVDPPEAVFASYLVRFQFQNFALASYVASYMRSAAYFSYVEGIKGGSAQPNANAQQLAGAKLVVAPEHIVFAFHRATEPLLNLIRANAAEIETLSMTRDLLLPRLLTGEITMKEVAP